MSDPVPIALVAEDMLSMAVLERIVSVSERSFVVTRRLVAGGFGNIKRSVQKYRQASLVVPHLVLTDLDRAECPASLRSQWDVAELPATMLFRVAVRETESWLLGDGAGFAQFAVVARNKVPSEPEALDDPKQALINLVRRSRNRRLAAELVPRQGSALSIGVLYNERLSCFARESWNVTAAADVCPSLRRMRQRLEAFVA